jgi:putative flippase GtrA
LSVRDARPKETVELARQTVTAHGGFFRNLWHTARLLKDGRVTRHVRRMVRFGAVGGSGVLVNMTLLYLLAGGGGMNHVVAAALATEAAILWNFTLNDRWTFSDAETAVSWRWRVLRYNSVALFGLAISVCTLAGLTYLLELHYLVANLFAIGAGTLWNYTGSSFFTWATVDSDGIDPRRLVAGSVLWCRRSIASVVMGVSKLWT